MVGEQVGVDPEHVAEHLDSNRLVVVWPNRQERVQQIRLRTDSKPIHINSRQLESGPPKVRRLIQPEDGFPF